MDGLRESRPEQEPAASMLDMVQCIQNSWILNQISIYFQPNSNEWPINRAGGWLSLKRHHRFWFYSLSVVNYCRETKVPLHLRLGERIYKYIIITSTSSRVNEYTFVIHHSYGHIIHVKLNHFTWPITWQQRRNPNWGKLCLNFIETFFVSDHRFYGPISETICLPLANK